MNIKGHFCSSGDLNPFAVISEFIICLIPWTVLMLEETFIIQFQILAKTTLVSVLNEIIHVDHLVEYLAKSKYLVNHHHICDSIIDTT